MSHSSSSEGKDQDIDESPNPSSSTSPLNRQVSASSMKADTPETPDTSVLDSDGSDPLSFGTPITIRGREAILRMSLAKHLVSLIRGTTEGMRVAEQPQQEMKENDESKISTTAANEESSKALSFIAV